VIFFLTKVTYICRSAKQKVVTYFILFLFLFLFFIDFFKGFFGRFVTRGVQKHENLFSRKSPSGRSSQKIRPFPPPFFFLSPWVVLFDFFCHVFGRFVTRGVQKRDKKKSRENPLSFQKKHLLTSLPPPLFHSPPCSVPLAPAPPLRATGPERRRRSGAAAQVPC
jgi:hypothetical protein